jgi:hypothetical protein
MATVKKTMVKKAEDGVKTKAKPRKPVLGYDLLEQAVNANDSEGLGYTKIGRKPTSVDSAMYRSGYGRGLRGGKEYPGEPNVQRMGRWEAQNDVKAIKESKAKAAVPKKKNGGSLKAVPGDKKKSLGKLPTAVRNKMGFQKNGGTMKAKSGASMKKCKYGCN